MREPVLRPPQQGRTIAVVGDVYRFLATGEETQGRYAILEAIVPPGGGPPPHVHSREEEGFYILEGEITFMVGAERIVAMIEATPKLSIADIQKIQGSEAAAMLARVRQELALPA